MQKDSDGKRDDSRTLFSRTRGLFFPRGNRRQLIVSLLVGAILILTCVQAHCGDRVCDIVHGGMHDRLTQAKTKDERTEAWRAIYYDLDDALTENPQSSCYGVGLIERGLSALKGGLYEEAAEAYDLVFSSGANEALVDSEKTIEKNAALSYLAVGRLEDATTAWEAVWGHAAREGQTRGYEELGHYLSSALEWLRIGQQTGRDPWVCLRPLTDVQTTAHVWRDADDRIIHVRFNNLRIALAAVNSFLQLDEPILWPGFIESKEELEHILDVRDSWHPEFRTQIEGLTAIEWPTGESFKTFLEDALVRVPHAHLLVTADSAENYAERAKDLAWSVLGEPDLTSEAFVEEIRLVRQLTQTGLLSLEETLALAEAVGIMKAERYSESPYYPHNIEGEMAKLRGALQGTVERIESTMRKLGNEKVE
jgi:hypothetical protein